MFLFGSRPAQIERLHRIVEATASPSHALMRDVITTVCPHHLEGHDENSVQLRQWLEAGDFEKVIRALVDWELPGWAVRRLVEADGVWWCTLSAAPGGPSGEEDIDESHRDRGLAILAALLAALSHGPTADGAGLPPPSSLGHPGMMAHWW